MTGAKRRASFRNAMPVKSAVVANTFRCPDSRAFPNVGSTREIATLRALGFSRISVLLSFVFESLCLALLGGALGCVLGLLAVKLALSGVTGTTNFATFSEVVFAFRLTPALLMTGIVFSLVMGFFGGLFPAGRAAFTKITIALRQVG